MMAQTFWTQVTIGCVPVSMAIMAYLGLPSALPCSAVDYWGYASMEFYFLFKLTYDASFLDNMIFSLFQKTSFHRIGTHIYFTV